jgi:hypothetical protein
MSKAEEIKMVKEKHEASIMAKKNVVGMGVGYKETKGAKTDRMALVVMVTKKVSAEELKSGDVIPADIEGVITDVIEVGEIVALQTRTDRWRPAPGGVSIGHYKITAGTLGVLVRDVETNEMLILSNNHVMANSNDATQGRGYHRESGAVRPHSIRIRTASIPLPLFPGRGRDSQFLCKACGFQASIIVGSDPAGESGGWCPGEAREPRCRKQRNSGDRFGD